MPKSVNRTRTRSVFLLLQHNADYVVYFFYITSPSLLSELRAKQLGLDKQLDDLMPPQLVCGKSEAKANWLANRLLFMLLRKGDTDRKELDVEQSYSWMYEAGLYLFEHCRWEDQTFLGFLKMIGLPFGVRAILFGQFEQERKFEHIRTDTGCPFKKADLEEVFVQLLSLKEREKRLNDLRALVDQN